MTVEKEIERLKSALINADRLAQAGDERAMQDARAIALRIRQLQSQSQGPDFLGRLNLGIAKGLGAPVDIVASLLAPIGLSASPEDAFLGSENIANIMRAVGVRLPEGPPQGIVEQFAQGGGEAAGFLLPMGAIAKGAQAMGPVASRVGQQIMAPFVAAPVRTTATEMAAGAGALAGGQAAANAAPEGFEPYAGILGSLAGGFAGGVGTSLANQLSPTRNIARGARSAIFPFTEEGGRIRASERLRSLSADPAGQAAALSQAPISDISPATQTGDPNLMALERAILQRNPALRDELAAKQSMSSMTLQQAAREPAEGYGFLDTRQFIEKRRADFISAMQNRIEEARRNAANAIDKLRPERAPGENSIIVRNQLQRAYDEAASLENDLWRSIDETVSVGTETARRTFADIDARTSQAQKSDIYSDARRFLGKEGSFKDQETVQEMRGLYSRLRRDAREAIAGPVPNENRARISNLLADAIWEDLTDVRGPVNPEIVNQLMEAREYSRAFNETFNQGVVGEILSRARTGAERVPPEMTLGATIGRGGTAGSVAASRITEAIDFPMLNPEVRASRLQTSGNAIEDFLKEGIRRAAIPGNVDLRIAPASEFAIRNAEVFSQYPVLSRQLQEALRASKEVGSFATRAEQRVSALQSPRRSVGAAIESAQYGSEIERAIFGAKNPVQAAREIARQASKDQTGAAVRGLKGGLIDYIMAQARSGSADAFGNQIISGNRLAGFLKDTKNQSVTLSILNRGELQRLNQIADELRMIEASRAGTSLAAPMEDLPNKAISFIAGTLAARAGAQLGKGTSGASLRTANLATKAVNDALGNLTNDKAELLLRDAIQDRELFRALLMPIGSREQAKNLERVLQQWAIGTSAVMATQDDGQ